MEDASNKDSKDVEKDQRSINCKSALSIREALVAKKNSINLQVLYEEKIRRALIHVGKALTYDVEKYRASALP